MTVSMRLGFAALFVLSACSTPTTPEPTLDTPLAETPKEVLQPDFTPQIEAALADFRNYQKVSEEMRLAPQLCREPSSIRSGGRVSKAEGAHARKLYFLYAKDLDGYLKTEPGTKAKVGQVLVKDAWTAHKTVAGEPLAFDARLGRLGEDQYMADKEAALFVMTKLDPETPGTDQGWIYGVTSLDRKTVVAAGVLEDCAGCHAKAPGDRLFGAPPSAVEGGLR